MHVRKAGRKGRYWVFSLYCLGCRCFQPGEYQHRGATSSGSHSTGKSTLTCMRSAYRGCPDDDGYTEERKQERCDEGWRKA